MVLVGLKIAAELRAEDESGGACASGLEDALDVGLDEDVASEVADVAELKKGFRRGACLPGLRFAVCIGGAESAGHPGAKELVLIPPGNEALPNCAAESHHRHLCGLVLG